MADPFNLERFLKAQNPILRQILTELREGQKRTHWMWFVFPQLTGLGRSSTARYYALASLNEAKAYLAHPILGPRLIEFTVLVNTIKDRSAHEIFGSPDDLKFHSSMTLFALAQPDEHVFANALNKYFSGIRDINTTKTLVQW